MTEPISEPISLRDRVDEMVCCVLDCALGGRELDAYIFAWMDDVVLGVSPGRPDVPPEFTAEAIVEQVVRDTNEIDAQAENLVELHERILASIHRWQITQKLAAPVFMPQRSVRLRLVLTPKDGRDE